LTRSTGCTPDLDEVHVFKSVARAATVPIEYDDATSRSDDVADLRDPELPDVVFARGSRTEIGVGDHDPIGRGPHADEPIAIGGPGPEPARPQSHVGGPIGRGPPADEPVAVTARAPAPPRSRLWDRAAVVRPIGRSRAESAARFLYFVSGALITGALTLFGSQMWRKAHPDPPRVALVQPTAAAVIIAAQGRIELSADRRGVTRLEGDAARWATPLSAPVDAIELTGPIVLGHTSEAIVALDLESGRTRFNWTLPVDEKWSVQPPKALAACLLIATARNHRTTVRCLDLASGAVRWTTAIPGGAACSQPAVAVPGAYLLPCGGWTAILDDRNGALAVQAGGGVLVQHSPPLLARAGARLAVMAWSPASRRFTAAGEQVFGASPPAISSAMLYDDRLVVRAGEASDELATVLARGASPQLVTAPVYRLADATPFTLTCGGETPPRFQLLELAPRIGASFEPVIAQDRALALLDVETGTLAWTSRKVAGLRRTAAARPPICRVGRYFIPLEIVERGGPPSATPPSTLWVIDATTGTTAAVVAFDPELDASFADLTVDQVDADRVVGISHGKPFEVRWRIPGRGLRDARRDLEAALGPLP
jgi:hypothetical protein